MATSNFTSFLSWAGPRNEAADTTHRDVISADPSLSVQFEEPRMQFDWSSDFDDAVKAPIPKHYQTELPELPRAAASTGLDSTSGPWRVAAAGSTQRGPSDTCASSWSWLSRADPQEGKHRCLRVPSAPLLARGCQTTSTAWHPSPSRRSTQSSWCNVDTYGAQQNSTSSTWRPLGDTWRRRSVAACTQMADVSKAFCHGAVPHWGKTAALRSTAVLEHELTWAYYRMKQRSTDNPLREEVGETLSSDGVPAAFRLSKSMEFQFWRDLRPPFHVIDVERVDEDIESSEGIDEIANSDGRLHRITYECGIDYCSERQWGEKQVGSTFDNKVHGVATVRLPESFPKKRPMVIVSWGKPALNSQDSKQAAEKAAARSKSTFVCPKVWSPIAEELGMRPDHPKLAAVREATRRTKNKKGSEVPPLQRLLLGPHASLPSLAHTQSSLTRKEAAARRGGDGAGDDEKNMPTQKREHRIFTPACGFVRYIG